MSVSQEFYRAHRLRQAQLATEMTSLFERATEVLDAIEAEDHWLPRGEFWSARDTGTDLNAVEKETKTVEAFRNYRMAYAKFMEKRKNLNPYL